MKIAKYLLLCVLCGCASTTVLRLDDNTKYKPSESIDLLFNEPQRPCKAIAIIEGNGAVGSNRLSVLKIMKSRAQWIGGHALWIIYNDSEYVPTTQHVILNTPITIPGGTKRDFFGIVVRYLDKPDSVAVTSTDTISKKPITAPATHRW